jgi:hypothetical protein
MPLTSQIIGETYKATHSYTGVNAKQLSFEKGALVTIVTKLANGWWQGRLEDGQVNSYDQSLSP